MIVPNSAISAGKMLPLQKKLIVRKMTWISNFAWRPAKLFEGADMLLAIILTSNSNASESRVFSTKYHRWYNDERDGLFKNLRYVDATKLIIEGSIPKLPSELFEAIDTKVKSKSFTHLLSHYFKDSSSHYLYTFRAVQYWVKILDFEPIYTIDGKKATTTEMKSLFLQDETTKFIIAAFLSSSLFFLYYTVYSSCQVINSRDFDIPFSLESMDSKTKNNLEELGRKLMSDLKKNSDLVEREYKGGFIMHKQHFYIKKSKPIIDEIDRVLAAHYGFTEEELNF
ncbi:hypothetical protein, partial [Schleiferia thermophila]